MADGLGGLFDGFEVYRSDPHDDYSEILTEGLVVPDSNVLLNLYRYHAGTRDDLLNVLRGLGDRLWVPHQVLVEFWRNRETVLLDPKDTDSTIEALRKARDETVRTFTTWANRVSLSAEKRETVTTALSSGFESAISGVDELNNGDTEEALRDTAKDAVLVELEPILAGRVGPALPEAEHAEAVKEADRRRQKRLPPGFRDDGPGDYLVWTQVLQQAERCKKNVLLVTGDVKEDWWRREHGQLRGPRPELAQEMLTRCGTHLRMLRPESLLRHARGVLSLPISEESVEDVERTDRYVADESTGGWSASALSQLIVQLRYEGWRAQADVIVCAAGSGGRVDRSRVYELAGYSSGRTLRRFTSPVSRIARDFRDQQIVPSTAIDVLTAEYDPAVNNNGQATGFVVPELLIPLLQELVN